MPNWLTPFLTLSYWFTPYPAPFQGVYFWIVVGLAGGSFLLGAILSFINSRINDPSTRRILNKLGTLGLTFGVLIALSFFFTQTSTPTLGSRFWFLLWIIVVLIWLGFIVKYAVWQAPKERAERKRLLDNQKYFNK